MGQAHLFVTEPPDEARVRIAPGQDGGIIGKTPSKTREMNCRNCFGSNLKIFLDLFAQPLSNSFIRNDCKSSVELYFPLVVYVCEDCYFVQIDEHQSADNIFTDDYVYYSSTTASFVEHARRYVDHITGLLGLDRDSLVIEAASNDGYLLQHFKARGIPHLGIEPTCTAEAAQAIGVRTLNEFFTKANAERIAKEYGPADLFLGNNVLAHVPNLDDFVGGIAAVLKPTGIATLEFPHLLNFMREVQFDTVYHEHYSYISYLAVRKTFERHGLEIFRIDELPVHGGSLRLYACLKGSGRPIEDSVRKSLADEQDFGLDKVETFATFQKRVDEICIAFTQFVLREVSRRKTIWAFGAAAKGNTFLNYCGIKANLISKIVDDTPAKQGRLAPGSRIPVVSQEALREGKPDYVVILPWNWRDTIVDKVSYISEWGGKFVTAIPELRIFEPNS